IPACGDIDSCAHALCQSKTPIFHWTAGCFCDGCLGGGAGSMSQGLRVLVLDALIVHQAVGGGFLRFEDFRKLLDDNPGLKRIELSNWGEIFLNPALLSVLKLAHERGVYLTADNGVNLNKIRPEVLEGLVRYQFRSLVCSIDGASEETYSIYRVRGKFANVIDNIRKINELKQRYSSPLPA